MKKTHIITQIVLVSWALSSCNSERTNASKESLNSSGTIEKADLHFSKILSFPLDSVTSNQSEYIQYFEDGDQQLLGCLNNYANSIAIFDIEQQKQVNTLAIPKEFLLKENISRFLGFHFYDLDKAIVIPKMRTKILKVNFRKNDYQVLDYKLKALKAGKDKSVPFPRVNYSNPVLLKDSSIYMTVHPEGNWNAIKDITTSPVCYQIDLNEKEVPHFLPLKYPRNYFEDGPTEPYFSQCMNDDQEFVYSFFADDNIYITDKSHTQWRKINAPSELRGEFLKNTMNPTMDDYLKFNIETSAYLWITYDKYRKCYYRLVATGSEYDADSDLMQQVNYPDLSLMVLNANLEVVNETLLDQKYNYKNYFINPDGLYLSLSNPANELYEEDMLRFQLIELN